MRSDILYNPFALLLAVALYAPSSVATAATQPGGTQDVCVGEPTGEDVFSVGELRTSILEQAPFQEMNGSEWVLANGRPLLVQTALSPHLSQENEYGLTIPDIRGRFLRMANNNVCVNLRGNDEEYGRCIATRDSDGDRLLGGYQADTFGRHDHGSHDHGSHGHGFTDVYYAETWGSVALPGAAGSADTDYDNRGYPMDSRTVDSGVPSSAVPPSGGAETRPKNIAVNYYIKICNCRTPNCR